MADESLKVRCLRALLETCRNERKNAEARAERYAIALQHLSFAAQTTGGVAGPDPELKEAIREAENELKGE